ncbi:UDP-N-acetylmuramoyl-L-alanyl-D-glutamate--2,6-diaminopimelate ligase [Alteribacter aurantiacus]|uniref:UDP-N-acetylmuramoyl-L-alanyl-D-glutamate--2, 6-diaminopimelate ligase n=1 Tax=Alteribacter aurantiacus TaxID=254410 RepID=UPI000425A0E8|nr:UDP-N-acetylmuramoyl-L-alanyl-D-glutamate--2,6-diaminopimelate ligase [Alteribacter aurantiacus]
MLLSFHDSHPHFIYHWGLSDTSFNSITYDSRKVEPGTAFICVKGTRTDGHNYLSQACEKGASIVVGTDADRLEQGSVQYPNTTFVQVSDAQSFMSYLSILLYDRAHEKLKTVAVTGTNGKTTVSSFVRSLLNKAKVPTGLIGTNGVWDDRIRRNFNHTTHTTPEAPDLQYIFHRFYEEGLQAVSLEATSIAIEQKRVDGVTFDVGVHTNLTPEHLDFHGSFDAYKRAKLKLFRHVKTAVVNLDDQGMSHDIINEFRGPLLTYSIKEEADIYVKNMTVTSAGTSMDLYIKKERIPVLVPLFGEYNISNFLASLGACLHLHVPVPLLLEGLRTITPPEGRFQIEESLSDYKIIMDFAHSPDALTNVITAVKSFSHRKLIVLVTGAGGGDPAQWPNMGAAVEGQADHIVVSVDHPDRLDRRDIVTGVLSGFQDPIHPSISTALDRAEGVHKALSYAEEGDIVLLTGIGFVGHQFVNGEEVPYSETETLEQYFLSEKNQKFQT